jgi:hypothetical protein
MIAMTQKSQTVCSRVIDHREPESVIYQIGIQNFWSFGLA